MGQNLIFDFSPFDNERMPKQVYGCHYFGSDLSVDSQQSGRYSMKDKRNPLVAKFKTRRNSIPQRRGSCPSSSCPGSPASQDPAALSVPAPLRGISRKRQGRVFTCRRRDRDMYNFDTRCRCQYENCLSLTAFHDAEYRLNVARKQKTGKSQNRRLGCGDF